MRKVCKITEKEFEITDDDLRFYERMEVSPPSMCPEERLRRRLTERNTRSLYYRTCDLSGKKILSQHHPDSPFPVYETPLWWSDQWDRFANAQDFDFSRPFFPQLLELKNKTPHMALYVISGTLENSDYNNCVGYIKNCYLIFEADYDEDCYFSNRIYHCKNLVDCSNGYSSELCYGCTDIQDCYDLKYSQECRQCQNSFFLYDCRSCRDCIGCINLRQKQYYILNKQYSREEYEKIKALLALNTCDGVEKVKKQCEEFFLTQPHQARQEEQNQNSIGDHLYNSKDAYYCFDAKDTEDCRYCCRVAGGVKSCMDYNSWGFGAELLYYSAGCGDGGYNLRFCSTCPTNMTNATYCVLCTGCKDIFGCVGLKQAQYCILNKQYSKDEYFTLRDKIIAHMKETGEWGGFFPNEFSSFAYNESLAMEQFSLSKENALKLGYRWRDEEKKDYKPQTYKIPDSIQDVQNNILDEVLACKATGKNYRIQKAELEFYRKMEIPVPTFCPDERHRQRLALRFPPRLYDRECDHCHEQIQSTYTPNRPEKVYCKKCYLERVG